MKTNNELLGFYSLFLEVLTADAPKSPAVSSLAASPFLDFCHFNHR